MGRCGHGVGMVGARCWQPLIWPPWGTIPSPPHPMRLAHNTSQCFATGQALALYVTTTTKWMTPTSPQPSLWCVASHPLCLPKAHCLLPKTGMVPSRQWGGFYLAYCLSTACLLSAHCLPSNLPADCLLPACCLSISLSIACLLPACCTCLKLCLSV